MASKIHDVAVSGFSAGTNDLYDKARLSYPPAALHTIHQAILSSRHTSPTGRLTIVEPGSGTGILSRLLLSPANPEYPSFEINTLVGVEPSAGMRTAWTRGLSKVPAERVEGRDVRAVEGAFDDYSPAGVGEGMVDGVVIAQAWHWCPDHSAAFRETAKYLRPNAPLILLWNIESNLPGWYQDIRRLYEPLDLGSPQYYRGWWRKCFEVPEYEDFFEGKEEGTSEWTLGMTEDKLVERLFSKSYLTEAHLSGQRRIDFEKELRQIIRDGDKEWVDKENGVFLYLYNTDYVIMRRNAT